MVRATRSSSGRWTLEVAGSGAKLTYQPSKSDETFTVELSGEALAKARTLARQINPAGLRDLLLGEERGRVLQSAANSALIAANTWRWALPLLGGPEPARRGRKA